MKKLISLFLAAVTVLLSVTPVYGRNAETDAVILKPGIAFVPFRDFCLKYGADKITWNPGSETATAFFRGYEIKVSCGQSYIEANERVLYLDCPAEIRDSRMMVPVRPLAKAMGLLAEWDPDSHTVMVSQGVPLRNGEECHSIFDIYWLSHIIYAEVGTESLYSQLAVGAVVLHRVKSGLFPNTIYEVIFDRQNGVQFTPTENGTVYAEPSKTSYLAAKMCLEGTDVIPGALFFATAGLSCWASKNRETAAILGSAQFYY